ncbi:hypothetical protein FSP39_009445 [Pinctada imbricata]|uniref:Rab-like protein 6 n=1 Tax=Pinctada imbricata TaxID=66713 RepID=A0AA89BST4_PINIB|nr:hypothetical protein FSP39_009445 [Pinctada imbricata]
MPFFRKLLGNQDGTQKGGEPKASPPAGMLTMATQLQRKFAKGIQYNMKIVIRGDRMVGKTCLFYRLQGQKFHEEYIPTEEIQVCSIQWNYKTTDDVVKVEVWDIVDKGKKKKTEGLKLSTEQDIEEPTLDAEFLDVYKGTHGVIFMYDVTKQWTFTYVEREIEKVPPHIPILVLGNHRDMGDHRTVMEDKARYFCRHLDRHEDSPQVRYAESSMKNGFGLKYLHKFFNIPFLKLQRETLLKQLEINGEDLQSTMEELDIHEESEEQNYTMFLDALTNKKQQQQEDSRRKSIEQDPKKTAEKPANLPVPKSVSMPSIPKSGVQPREAASVGNTPLGRGQPIPTTQTPTPGSTSQTPTQGEPQTTPQQPEQKSGFFSRFFKSKEQTTPKQEVEVAIPEEIGGHSAVKSVEDFIPDGGVIDKSFLEDTKEVKDVSKVTKTTDSDSDEESTGNPMVAGFQDDLDSDEDFKDSGPSAVTQDVELSSDDEDEVHVAMTTKDVDISDDEDLNSPSVHVVTANDDISSDENELLVQKY